MTMQTLPLFSLTLSALNVRKTERDADIAALAEDIAACGLKQNLVVIPAHFSTAELPEGSNYGDRFEVIAGGRRYQALRLLADEGRIEPDHPVPVLVEPRDAAQQTSLSENLHRVAMNPADEFEAFATIAAKLRRDGESEPGAIAACAKRFGVTVKHVEGRLRLAALCPEVLEALRANEISLDSAKAYAITTDHGHQSKVFKAQLKTKWSPHDPRTVRNALRGITVAIDSQLAKYVGLVAYRAAGGETETEMFMGSEAGERIANTTLLERLAREKAEGEIARQAKADGFQSGLLAHGGPDWNIKWPKEPTGFERGSGYHAELADTKKAQRKTLIGVYRIAGDGDGLEYVGYLRPIPEKAGDDGAEEDRHAQPERDWEAERRESARRRQIERRAARMALGPVGSGYLKGTPLEGRAWWPSYSCRPVEQHPDDETTLLVTVQIAVPLADVQARIEEATRLVDEEAAAAAAQQEEETEE